ncbi:hypothetical protein C1Y40_04651 [Mycobacterium talmoniae]|uniref:Polysaccharide pyruvyl transferase domain-containing protein n=1 Tax=Mycobacterium talmoniae TaxID=1858794 RepID=A0A2S8BEU4_9MYCO|nr:polysaccharide pyruvyl transferase family protein [Mycobacterium eburneum]PQM45191.1 hypothetical protein C1Y40_04651 [Mycobacterium talmoniae]
MRRSRIRSQEPGGSAPWVGYLGWHGRGNIGDDAIYDAVRSQLPGAAFVDLPCFPHERIWSPARGLHRSLAAGTQVVGGGTIVGRRSWRRAIKRGSALTNNTAGYAIGVGVEDPVFQGRRSGSAGDELRRWPAILSEFHTVSVRGPRSAELLSDVGLTVEVAGDPALLLPQPDVAPEEGLIGVNLGFGDDLWGHDPNGLADEISRAVKHLSSQGYRFVGILMNPKDRRWTEVALDGIAADIVLPGDARAAAAELARCSVAVVSRLHAGILASLSATPTIALEYQPKCRDFALSMDNAGLLIRTDQLTSTAVIDRVGDALAGGAALRSATGAAVDRLRSRLQTEYGALAGQLGLARP